MPADPTVRVEYVVRCREQEMKAIADGSKARRRAKQLDFHNNPCGPHRVIKRTITETDVTEDVPDGK